VPSCMVYISIKHSSLSPAWLCLFPIPTVVFSLKPPWVSHSSPSCFCSLFTSSMMPFLTTLLVTSMPCLPQSTALLFLFCLIFAYCFSHYFGTCFKMLLLSFFLIVHYFQFFGYKSDSLLTFAKSPAGLIPYVL
jgi:hypothetical protein